MLQSQFVFACLVLEFLVSPSGNSGRLLPSLLHDRTREGERGRIVANESVQLARDTVGSLGLSRPRRGLFGRRARRRGCRKSENGAYIRLRGHGWRAGQRSRKLGRMEWIRSSHPERNLQSEILATRNYLVNYLTISRHPRAPAFPFFSPLSEWMFVRLCTAAFTSVPRVRPRRPLVTGFQRLALASSSSVSAAQHQIGQHEPEHVFETDDSADAHMPKRQRSPSDQDAEGTPGFMKPRAGKHHRATKTKSRNGLQLRELEPPTLYDEASIRQQFHDLDIRSGWFPQNAKNTVYKYVGSFGGKIVFNHERGTVAGSAVYR
jgi:hypothetical protein